MKSISPGWAVSRTKPQYDLPPVVIMTSMTPFSVQDYLTPDEARSFAAELVRVADEVDGIESVRQTLESAEVSHFEHEDM